MALKRKFLLPYKIHAADWHSLCIKLADLLSKVPNEAVFVLLTGAQNWYRLAEFGQPGLKRNADANDPYWFEHHLIARAEALLAEGKPLDVWRTCINEHNHGHSGWVDQTDRVYRRPNDEMEQQVSEELRSIIIKVAEGLIASNPPALELGMLAPGPLSMIALYECLCMLGADVPVTLLHQFKPLMTEYLSVDPSNRDCREIQKRFECRFNI